MWHSCHFSAYLVSLVFLTQPCFKILHNFWNWPLWVGVANSTLIIIWHVFKFSSVNFVADFYKNSWAKQPNFAKNTLSKKFRRKMMDFSESSLKSTAYCFLLALVLGLPLSIEPKLEANTFVSVFEFNSTHAMMVSVSNSQQRVILSPVISSADISPAIVWFQHHGHVYIQTHRAYTHSQHTNCRWNDSRCESTKCL